MIERMETFQVNPGRPGMECRLPAPILLLSQPDSTNRASPSLNDGGLKRHHPR